MWGIGVGLVRPPRSCSNNIVYLVGLLDSILRNREECFFFKLYHFNSFTGSTRQYAQEKRVVGFFIYCVQFIKVLTKKIQPPRLPIPPEYVLPIFMFRLPYRCNKLNIYIRRCGIPVDINVGKSSL